MSDREQEAKSAPETKSKKSQKGIKCLSCEESLWSNHVHQLVRCKCENKAFVDGGDEYFRCGAMDIKKIEIVWR